MWDKQRKWLKAAQLELTELTPGTAKREAQSSNQIFVASGLLQGKQATLLNNNHYFPTIKHSLYFS